MGKRLTLAEQLNSASERYEALSAMHNATTAKVLQLESELANARATIQRIGDAPTKIVELEKKLVEAENMKKYYDNLYATTNRELEAVHDVLDGVEGAPGRQYETDYGKKDRTAVARLAGTFVALARGAKQ